MNAIRTLVDGRAEERIAATDRGLLYGDGLFETIRFGAGRAPLWDRHMARLAAGCGRLGLPLPDEERLAHECREVMAGLGAAVVRITLTRGHGERGYAPPREVVPTRIVAAHPSPDLPRDWYARGIRVRFCAVRLARQPLLAGMKHLNRLEQVLARAEWNDAAIPEGLMLDTADHVVCATAANLFAVIDGALCTPPVDLAGVAGVARAETLAVRTDTRLRELTRADLAAASELFLTSSVRGIVPITATDEADYGASGPVARALQAHWRDLGLSPEVM